ncbi:WxcM-like domain-containing protein [Algoriella sp.]|uniref:WxcM-like domain-containing protein n=1 Tax=Algoriella sp. TaxID=1872434 RepID=UPI002FCB451F
MLIKGNKFVDERGKLFYNNDFNLSETKRMYILENQDISIIRAWQAHKIEKRWFVAVDGQFEIKLVKIDNFENPSENLKVEKFVLSAETMDCLYIQPGYGTSIQALSDNAKLAVFSNYLLGEINDDYKFDSQKWK